MTSIDPYSRQQPIPGRGGPGDLGSPATWERRPLAQITVQTGDRAAHSTVVMAKGENGFFARPAFEPVGTDFARAIQLAADRANSTSGRIFAGAASQGVLQAFDGQLYLATLASESGIGVSLDGEGGIFDHVVTSVSVAKLHPALQAVVGRRSMIDLRADQPQPLPPGGTVPYMPIPGVPQQPAPLPPGPLPTPSYPTPYPPTDPTSPGDSWWDRLRKGGIGHR
jgi:hypothetical protein